MSCHWPGNGIRLIPQKFSARSMVHFFHTIEDFFANVLQWETQSIALPLFFVFFALIGPCVIFVLFFVLFHIFQSAVDKVIASFRGWHSFVF